MNHLILWRSREILYLEVWSTELDVEVEDALLQFLLGPFIQFAVFDASCHHT